MDAAANARNAARISPPGARVQAFVVENDENLAIARQVRATLGREDGGAV